jgi:hypothetical protein
MQYIQLPGIISQEKPELRPMFFKCYDNAGFADSSFVILDDFTMINNQGGSIDLESGSPNLMNSIIWNNLSISNRRIQPRKISRKIY